MKKVLALRPSTALAKIDAQTTFLVYGIDAFRCTAGATKKI
jgi:hypothetical protein